jgi:hypothetical protein
MLGKLCGNLLPGVGTVFFILRKKTNVDSAEVLPASDNQLSGSCNFAASAHPGGKAQYGWPLNPNGDQVGPLCSRPIRRGSVPSAAHNLSVEFWTDNPA